MWTSVYSSKRGKQMTTATSKQLKQYEVTACPKRPSYGDRGAVLEIAANNKAEAISHARKAVARECLYDRFDGPLVYTAQVRE
jgi:hypothetical protein